MRGFDLADLQGLVERGAPDLFLGVVAEAHGELVVEIQEVGRLGETDGHGVGQKVGRVLVGDAPLAQAPDRVPGLFHRRSVELCCFRNLGEQHGHDVVRLIREVRRQRRPRAWCHPVPLVLTVGRVGELLAEGVRRVEHRPREFSVRGQGEGLAEQAVPAGVEHEADRLVVGKGRARQAQDLAHRGGEHLLVVGLPVDQPRDAPSKLLVELAPKRGGARAGRPQRLKDLVLGSFFERDRVLQHGRVERVVAEDFLHHLADDLALLGRRVEGLAEPPVTEQRDSGDRVVQVGERCDRQDVARDFLRALLHRASKPRAPVAPGAARKDAEVPLPGGGRQQLRQAPVGLLLPPGLPLVDLPLGRAHCWDRIRAGLDLDVALRDLLGVVEGVTVEESPQELPRDVLEGELKVRVLERRVVARLVDRARERVAALRPRGRLIFSDDPLGGVAGARRRDDVLEGPLERVDEADLRRQRREGEGAPADWETRHRVSHSSRISIRAGRGRRCSACDPGSDFRA